MARVLIIYHRGMLGAWRATYESHVTSFSKFSDHECLYLNTARSRVPKYIRSFEPDLVIFHYTFLAVRQDPPAFLRQMKRIDFLKELSCPKALVPHDEQAHSDFLCSVIEKFGVTHVFTPASPPEWPQIYEGIDLGRVRLHTVLTGYVDEDSAARVAVLAQQHNDRPVDIGYRAWDSYPFYGRHGQLKAQIGRLFREEAPRFGLTADISSSYKDALMGDSWFDFLLKCKYTIGVEGGSSVFDRDGAIAECCIQYAQEHPDSTFEEVGAACFPGVDGGFGYRLIGPRHLEAVMTGTCQILVEGDYAGVLWPGEHYIELKRDFSNLAEVLEATRDAGLRERMVKRAYDDIISSGRYSYRAFAELVFAESLGDTSVYDGINKPGQQRGRVLWNRLDDRWWLVRASIADGIRRALRPALSRLLGEERLTRTLSGVRAFRSRLLRRSR